MDPLHQLKLIKKEAQRIADFYNNFQSGSGTTDAAGDATVTFLAPYSGVPKVFLRSVDAASRGIVLDVVSKSKTGFTVKARKTTGITSGTPSATASPVNTIDDHTTGGPSAPHTTVATSTHTHGVNYSTNYGLINVGYYTADVASSGHTHSTHQAQTSSTSAGASTTSTTPVDLLTINMTTGANPVLMIGQANLSGSPADTSIAVGLAIDGTGKTLAHCRSYKAGTAGDVIVVTPVWLETVTAASHTFKLRWQVPYGGTGYVCRRTLVVVELRDATATPSATTNVTTSLYIPAPPNAAYWRTFVTSITGTGGPSATITVASNAHTHTVSTHTGSRIDVASDTHTHGVDSVVASVSFDWGAILA